MRVGAISTCSKPADVSLSRYSFSSSAPATHPTHSNTFCQICASTSPRVTTSETASRPLGLSTRRASRNTASLSAERLTTQFEMITSTELSGSGICSISTRKNSTFSAPALRLFSFASASISSVMSRPYALPVGPTRFAESSTSIPPPDPRSSTTSPGFNLASAVGFPQPSEACSASPGTCSICAASYKLEVMGSQLVPLASAVPQQLALFPLSAACPYFSLTISLMFALSISSSYVSNPAITSKNPLYRFFGLGVQRLLRCFFPATFNFKLSIEESRLDRAANLFDSRNTMPLFLSDLGVLGSFFLAQPSTVDCRPLFISVIEVSALPASLRNIFRLQRLVPRAALRIKKLQQFLQRFGVRCVTQKRALPLHKHESFI